MGEWLRRKIVVAALGAIGLAIFWTVRRYRAGALSAIEIIVAFIVCVVGFVALGWSSNPEEIEGVLDSEDEDLWNEHAPTPRISVPRDDSYVFFGGLSDLEQQASYRIQDLLKEEIGEAPRKPAVGPYIALMKTLSQSELRAIVAGTTSLEELASQTRRGQ